MEQETQLELVLVKRGILLLERALRVDGEKRKRDGLGHQLEGRSLIS